MKFNFLILSGFFFFGISSLNADDVRIINNSDLPLNVDLDVPIYSRADTKIQPIKSQQELQDLLHDAILTNSTKAIMQVVKAGADVNLFKDGKAPLMWAILKKFNSVEVLKKCGAVIPCPKNMLYRAILNDSAEEIKQAIDAGADSNEENLPGSTGLHPLGLAIFLTKSKAVQALLECGAVLKKLRKPNARVELREPVEYAVNMRDIKTALILLKNVNKKNKKQTDQIFTMHGDIFRYVINNIDHSGIKDLIVEFFQECINCGYNINSPNHASSAWVSGLQSQFCSLDILELLMKNGANPNQQISYGMGFWTPLFFAIEGNNLKGVQFLVDAGADLNTKASVTSGRGMITQTPLAFAQSPALVHFKNQEIINLLRSNGAHL